MSKPRIFVRYQIGSSGNFITALCYSLVTEINEDDLRRAHFINHVLTKFHNFNIQWSLKDFNEYTRLDCNVDASTNWVKTHFKFYEQDTLPVSIVHTHAINPIPLISAFEHSKLINICYRDTDIDQLIFNWVTKSLLVDHDDRFVNNFLNNCLIIIEIFYKKLKNVTIKNIDFNDIKLLCWIVKYGQSGNFIDFEKFTALNNHLSISFRDIFNGDLNLDSIIDFLGIEPMTFIFHRQKIS